jgi:hypothetical protein
MAEDEAEADPFLGGLVAPAILGAAYAAWLSTEDGKAWIDENTTLGVVLGVSGVLAMLRLALPATAWGAWSGRSWQLGRRWSCVACCGSSEHTEQVHYPHWGVIETFLT